MAAEPIKVSTSEVSDPTKPRVTATFKHDIPDTIEEAQKRFPATMESGKLVDPVYELFKSAYVIAMQAPARKELVMQWENLPTETRNALVVAPQAANGQYTATLPEEQQILLQARMDAWVLGERSPRVRTVRMGSGDPVKDFMDALPALSDERRAEIALQVAALLGVNSAAVAAPALAPIPSGGRRR